MSEPEQLRFDFESCAPRLLHFGQAACRRHRTQCAHHPQAERPHVDDLAPVQQVKGPGIAHHLLHHLLDGPQDGAKLEAEEAQVGAGACHVAQPAGWAGRGQRLAAQGEIRLRGCSGSDLYRWWRAALHRACDNPQAPAQCCTHVRRKSSDGHVSCMKAFVSSGSDSFVGTGSSCSRHVTAARVCMTGAHVIGLHARSAALCAQRAAWHPGHNMFCMADSTGASTHCSHWPPARTESEWPPPALLGGAPAVA